MDVQHIGAHGVRPQEVEQIIAGARPPWPRYTGDGKYTVWGQTQAGEHLQAIFVYDDDDETAYVIHARPLNEREKRQYRRRRH